MRQLLPSRYPNESDKTDWRVKIGSLAGCNRFDGLAVDADRVRRRLIDPSTSQKNNSVGILEQASVLIPPAIRQRRIVSNVEQLISLSDALQAQLATTMMPSEQQREEMSVATPTILSGEWILIGRQELISVIARRPSA